MPVGNPRTWTPNEIVTAALLNTEIRDQFNEYTASGTGGIWVTYTPAWTADTNPTIGNGTRGGRYRKIGKLVHFAIGVVMGSTTTYGSGQWKFSLPFTARTDGTNSALSTGIIGAWLAGDSSLSQVHEGIIHLNNGVAGCSTHGAPMGSITNTTPFTWATGDKLTLRGVYEAA